MFLLRVSFFLFVCLINPVQARMEVVPQTAILATDTNANDKLKLKQAFAQILANNTGIEVTRILKNPVFLQTNIKAGIKRSYFEKIKAKAIDPQSPYKYWFHVLMKEKFIQSVMAQAHFSFVPANKRKIMLWLAQTQLQDEKEEIVYAFNNEVAQYWLQHWAKTFGIELFYPKLDDDDKLQVSPQSIKNLAYKAIIQSKEKYHKKHSLMLFIKQKEDFLKIRTGLVIKNTDVDINYVQEAPDKIENIYLSIMADVARKLTSAYQIPASSLQNQTVHFVVKDINNYDDVLKTMAYLDELAIIDNKTMITASKHQLVFTMDLLVNTTTLINMLNADDILIADENHAINKLEFFLKSDG